MTPLSLARMDFPFLFFFFSSLSLSENAASACVNGITVYADAREIMRDHILPNAKINGAPRTTLLHFGVDNLTLWQLRRPAATAALIADITPRQIVVAASRYRRVTIHTHTYCKIFNVFSLIFFPLYIPAISIR